MLTAGFHGYTDGYTTVNGSFGVKWHGGAITTTVKMSNLFHQTVQQHIFGDLTLIAKSSKHENAKQPHWAQARSSCWGTRGDVPAAVEFGRVAAAVPSIYSSASPWVGSQPCGTKYPGFCADSKGV